MGYLVDTNVFSELIKPGADPAATAWVSANEAGIYISTISLGEIRYGIALLDEGKRKEALQQWLSTLAVMMEGRTLSFNRSVTYVWAEMRASLHKQGRRVPLADGMIAATAKRHQLTIATRNTEDFRFSGVSVINPFDGNQTGLTE